MAAPQGSAKHGKRGRGNLFRDSCNKGGVGGGTGGEVTGGDFVRNRLAGELRIMFPINK